MKYANKSLLILAMAGIMCLTGCKKIAESLEEKAPQLSQALSGKSWDKSEVNSLLTYVPADTAAIFATTRQFDFDNPTIKMVLSKGLKNFDASLDEAKNRLKQLPPDSKDMPKLKALIDTLEETYRPMLADFSNESVKWGFDPKHMDSIIYLNDTTLVAKVTVADGNKLKAKLTESLNAVNHLFGALANNNAPKVELKEIKAGGETWSVYSTAAALEKAAGECIACENGKTTLPTDIAIHFGKEIVTMAFVVHDDTATLEKLLKPAANPLNKKDLGTISDTTAYIGYVNNVALYNQITRGNGLKFIQAMGLETSPECIAEIGQMVSVFPKFKHESQITPSNHIVSSNTLMMNDKEELKKINELHTQGMDLIKDGTLAGIGLNLNIPKFIAYLQEIGDKLKAKSYKCEAIREIPSAIGMMAVFMLNPEISKYTSAITGISAALTKLDITGAEPQIEAAVHLTGPQIAAAIQDDSLPLKLLMVSPYAAKAVKNIKKGEVSEIDLSPTLNMPLKLSTYLSDTDLVLGTSSFDVQSIANQSKVQSGDFLRIAVDTSILALAGLNLPVNFTQELIDTHFGSNDEGFFFTAVLKQ